MIKKLFNNKYVLFGLVFLLPTLALLTALISQYFFGLKPCILCIYQRIPFVVIIVLGALFFFSKYKRLILVLIIFNYLINSGIGIFHVGVENKWWQGTSKCGTTIKAKTVEELRKQILNAPITKCDERTPFLLGFSMAELNFVFCLGMAFVLSLVVFYRRKKRIVL